MVVNGHHDGEHDNCIASFRNFRLQTSTVPKHEYKNLSQGDLISKIDI